MTEVVKVVVKEPETVRVTGAGGVVTIAQAVLPGPPGPPDSGYLWGTDGTDGVLRMGASMSWTKDAGNAYVTLDVSVVDGGTF